MQDINLDFHQAFGLTIDEAAALTTAKIFEPSMLLALYERVPTFDGNMLYKALVHRNAPTILCAISELAYLNSCRQGKPGWVEITPEALNQLIDDDIFWKIYARSMAGQGGEELGHESLLRSYFRGAFAELIERRKQEPKNSEDYLTRPVLHHEIYSQADTRWQITTKRSGMQTDASVSM